MDERRQVKISKFLSYVLRHHPESIGIKLDKNGWADVKELLSGAEDNSFQITLDELTKVVKENDKQRFALSDDGLNIRVSYGHSIPLDLSYSPAVPPDVLYHGTAEKNLKSIRETGLVTGNRQHVHLSTDADTAASVGQRHGRPRVIVIQARQMYADGYRFYFATNKVWLTEYVPPEYLMFPGN